MSFRRRFRPLPANKLQVTDAFWGPRLKQLSEVTLLQQWDQIVETGRYANFLRAAGKEDGPHQGRIFNDSDVTKWLEACAFALAHHTNANLKAACDKAIEAIIAAQMPDGYLNTFFQLKHPQLRWRNLMNMHEMYCGGHLLEAGVAWFELLGDKRLLDVSVKFADHVLDRFGPTKTLGYCGHEEFELALIKLAHTTKNERYRDHARWMVEVRGQSPSPFEKEFEDAEAIALSPYAKMLYQRNGKYVGEYAQDHAPIREHKEVVGHAVRAMYLYIAAADLADGVDDEPLYDALLGCWQNLTEKRMYITGGIGPSGDNEGFTTDYDLPNHSAYAETCAAVGLALWGQKMLEMTGEADFADTVERAIFNGAISGISLSGDKYFYTNPLESRADHERVPWFDCACCPPNIARMIGQIASFAYGVSKDTLCIQFPVAGTLSTELGEFKVSSNYPWSGEFTVQVEQSGDYAVAVRIPGWCGDTTLTVDDAEEEAEFADGYAVVKRTWNKGDTLRIEWEMEPRWLAAHPKVYDNAGRFALTRGPLVYAAEAIDLGFPPQHFSVQAEIELETVEVGGMIALEAHGAVDVAADDYNIYRTPEDDGMNEASALFRPYFAWNNRGKTEMQVWVRTL